MVLLKESLGLQFECPFLLFWCVSGLSFFVSVLFSGGSGELFFFLRALFFQENIR